MIPGKKYTPEDLLDIAKRRWWLIVLPFLVVSIGTAIYARLLPNLYRSETVILVVPQQIPESYVRATFTTRIEDRLQSIQQQILSRTFLERIILDFDLYARARKTTVMENVVETMRRRDISIETVKGDAFRVAYVSGDPQIAMKVTERLAALFIEENRHDREVLANGTNQFLESQLEDARRRLAEHEKRSRTTADSIRASCRRRSSRTFRSSRIRSCRSRRSSSRSTGIAIAGWSSSDRSRMRRRRTRKPT